MFSSFNTKFKKKAEKNYEYFSLNVECRGAMWGNLIKECEVSKIKLQKVSQDRDTNRINTHIDELTSQYLLGIAYLEEVNREREREDVIIKMVDAAGEFLEYVMKTYNKGILPQEYIDHMKDLKKNTIKSIDDKYKKMEDNSDGEFDKFIDDLNNLAE